MTSENSPLHFDNELIKQFPSKPHLTLTAGIFKQPYEIFDVVYGYHQLVLENTWSQYSPLDKLPLL